MTRGPYDRYGHSARRPWDEFEMRLVLALRAMPLESYLILETIGGDEDEPGYYVQFAQAGRAGFRAEAVSNRFLPVSRALTRIQAETLARLGWTPPGTGYDANFYRLYDAPVPFGEVACLSIETMRDVFGVPGPAALGYIHESFKGSRVAMLDLGLARQRRTGT